MKTTAAKKRIHNVFNKSLENIKDGKEPNVMNVAIGEGYSRSYAHAGLITKTKTWQELLNEIQDDVLRDKLMEIALDTGDKRASLTALDMILKLKNKYPAKELKFGAMQRAVEELSAGEE